MRGQQVCRVHGGAAKRARERAKIRLLSAADWASGELIKIAMDKKQPGNVRAKALDSLLDRAGMVMPKQLEVDVKDVAKILRNSGIVSDSDEEDI